MKLSSGKLPHFSDIWRAFSALMFLLESKGKGVEKQRGPLLLFEYSKAQSTYIYRAPQCMSLRRNWDSPNPSPASKCALPPPPHQRVAGAHWPAAVGVGESQFRRLEKKLSTLPTLCSKGKSANNPWEIVMRMAAVVSWMWKGEYVPGVAAGPVHHLVPEPFFRL